MTSKLKIILLLFLMIIKFYCFGQQNLTLVYPNNNYISQYKTIIFKWNKINNTQNYNILISNKNDFSNIIYQNTVSNNSDTVSLNSYGLYYWKIKSLNSNWSKTRSFYIFIPTVIENIKLWVSADSGISLENNLVTSIKDLSNNNNNPTQNISSKKPLYIDNYGAVFNNKPIIYFDGSDDYLEFSTINDIRTLFFLGNEDSNATDKLRPLLGHSTLYDFHRGNNKIIFGGNTSEFIKNGKTYINGHIIDIFNTLMPTKLSIININTTDNISANNISNDRINYGRLWQGNIAEIIIYSQILNDSLRSLVEQYLRCKYNPPVNLGYDINITYGFSDTTISAYKPWFTSYNWNNGSTDSAITVSKSGQYTVTVTDIFGFISKDSVIVSYPEINYPCVNGDTIICLGDTLWWDTKLSTGYTHEWYPVQVSTTIYPITKAGKYSVKVSDSKGYYRLSDTITIKIDSFPQIVSLGNDTTLCKGNNLYLQSGSNAAVSYLWNTGSTDSYITLQEPDEYSVTTTNIIGCIAKDTVNIDINGIAPVPDFTFSNQCFGDTVLFTDASTSPDGSIFTGWQWNFGDGNGSNNQNSNHQFADTGIYTVILTVNTQNNCSNSIRKTVDIYSNPVAGFLPDITCSNSPTILHDISTSIDGNITNRQWIFPDGTTDTVQNPEYTFTLAGKIPVQLIVETNLTCSDTLTKVIDIKQGAVADFSYSAACNQKPVYFTDKSESFLGSELNYKWTFEPGSISTQNNPQYTFPDTGIYTVTLEVNQQINNCNSIVYKTIKVNQNPVAAFSKGTICEKNGTTLIDISTSPQGTITEPVWQIDSIGTLAGNIVTVQFDTSGNYKTILTVKDNNGCIATITDTLTVNPLPLPHFLTNVQKGAVPLSVEFTNQTTGAEEYLWTFGDGYTSTEFSPEHTFTDSGNYNVKMLAISNMGCVDSSFSIIKAIMPHIDIAIDKAFAEKDNGYLKISANIQNLGTLNLDNVELFYKTNYGQTIKEILPFTLESGQTVNYEFTTQTQIKSDIELTHVCIWALPSNQTDETPDNNEKCIAFENAFKAMQPYPNPAKDKLVIEYIIPYKANVRILLFNQFGQLTNILYDKKSAAGINRLVFDVRTLSRGTYIYRIEFEDNVKSYQIMIK